MVDDINKAKAYNSENLADRQLLLFSTLFTTTTRERYIRSQLDNTILPTAYGSCSWSSSSSNAPSSPPISIVWNYWDIFMHPTRRSFEREVLSQYECEYRGRFFSLPRLAVNRGGKMESHELWASSGRRRKYYEQSRV